MFLHIKDSDLILLGTTLHWTSFLCLLPTAVYIAAKYSHIKGIEMEIIRDRER